MFNQKILKSSREHTSKKKCDVCNKTFSGGWLNSGRHYCEGCTGACCDDCFVPDQANAAAAGSVGRLCKLCDASKAKRTVKCIVCQAVSYYSCLCGKRYCVNHAPSEHMHCVEPSCQDEFSTFRKSSIKGQHQSEEAASTILFGKVEGRVLKPITTVSMREMSRCGSALGEGSFGEVIPYRYKDQAVAFKQPLDDDEVQSQSIFKEAIILNELSHPNVIPLIGLVHGGNHIGMQGFVMPRIQAEPLNEAVEKLSEPQRIPYVMAKYQQLLEAVKYIHQQGVIHRDIHPGNILINRQGNWVLIDFGLAVFQEELAEGAPHLAGHAAYRSPEVWMYQKYSTGSDCYAVYITLNELLSETHFRSLPDPAIRHAVAYQDRRPAIAPNVPKAMQAQIKRGWDPDPLQRRL